MKTNESNLVKFCRVAVCLVPYGKGSSYDFRWLMKYFKKQKWRTGINLKPYESEKKSEIMWVNVKVGEKKKRKGFYGGIKTI